MARLLDQRHLGHDDPLLVEQIRRRILPRRGIMASDDEILITLGAQNALYLLTQPAGRAGHAVAMEEPGFPDMRNIFRTQDAASRADAGR